VAALFALPGLWITIAHVVGHQIGLVDLATQYRLRGAFQGIGANVTYGQCGRRLLEEALNNALKVRVNQQGMQLQMDFAEVEFAKTSGHYHHVWIRVARRIQEAAESVWSEEAPRNVMRRSAYYGCVAGSVIWVRRKRKWYRCAR